MTKRPKSNPKNSFAAVVQGWSYAPPERLAAMIATAEPLASSEDDHATLQAMRRQYDAAQTNQR